MAEIQLTSLLPQLSLAAHPYLPPHLTTVAALVAVHTYSSETLIARICFFLSALLTRHGSDPSTKNCQMQMQMQNPTSSFRLFPANCNSQSTISSSVLIGECAS